MNSYQQQEDKVFQENENRRPGRPTKPEIEKTNNVTKTIKVDKTLYSILETHSKETSLPISRMINDAIESYIVREVPYYLGDAAIATRHSIDSEIAACASPQVHTDSVNHPPHYCSHPSGIECIEIARHYCFSIGNAFKYLWRAGLKEEIGVFQIDKEIEDLEKAAWYIQDRINQLKAKKNEEA